MYPQQQHPKYSSRNQILTSPIQLNESEHSHTLFPEPHSPPSLEGELDAFLLASDPSLFTSHFRVLLCLPHQLLNCWAVSPAPLTASKCDLPSFQLPILFLLTSPGSIDLNNAPRFLSPDFHHSTDYGNGFQSLYPFVLLMNLSPFLEKQPGLNSQSRFASFISGLLLLK